MSLAELCKSTAKKAKYKSENKALLNMESPELDKIPKRVGPHTPPLPRDSTSPHHIPEPSSTADISKSYFSSDDTPKKDSRYMHRHRATCSSTSTSSSPEPYRNRDYGRSYSSTSTRHGNATSTTGLTLNSYEDSTPEVRDRLTKRITLEKSSSAIITRPTARSREKSSELLRYYDKEHLRRTKRVSSPDKLEFYSDDKRERERLRRKYVDDEWSHSSSTSKCAVPASEKIPYFVDEKREQDRLRRKYGENYRTCKRHTPDKMSYSYHKYEDDYVKRRRSYSRSKSPILPHTHRRQTRHRETHRRLSSSNERRDHYFSSYRRHGQSRSRSRDRKHILPPPPTQIITIPVPVADYPYAFHAWGSPFPLGHMMPSDSLPPIRPPYGLPPFNSGMFRPQQRYSNIRNFPPQPLRGNFGSRIP